MEASPGALLRTSVFRGFRRYRWFSGDQSIIRIWIIISGYWIFFWVISGLIEPVFSHGLSLPNFVKPIHLFFRLDPWTSQFTKNARGMFVFAFGKQISLSFLMFLASFDVFWCFVHFQLWIGFKKTSQKWHYSAWWFQSALCRAGCGV